MITFLILSALGMGVTQFLKKSTGTATDSQGSEENRQRLQLITKTLKEDLQQAVFLNPSCAENPAPNPASAINTPCSDVSVRGGVQPYPGTALSTISALSSLSPPANLEAATSSLAILTDSLRILSYDFTGSFNCRLNRGRAINPSQTAGQGSGAERLWADSSCSALLGATSVGRLFILSEVFDTDTSSAATTDLIPYSNLFQITAYSDLGTELQIDVQSFNNRFNQIGGLARSGFSNRARIYPVKFIEWSYDDGSGDQAAGLYRREIRPTSTDLLGYGEWKLIDPAAVGIQFYPLTATTTTPIVHQRTLQLDADANNNGLEDIKGITPRIVLQGERARTDGKTFDNPLTSTVETGNFSITDARFFVEMRNTKTNN